MRSGSAQTDRTLSGRRRPEKTRTSETRPPWPSVPVCTTSATSGPSGSGATGVVPGAVGRVRGQRCVRGRGRDGVDDEVEQRVEPGAGRAAHARHRDDGPPGHRRREVLAQRAQRHGLAADPALEQRLVLGLLDEGLDELAPEVLASSAVGSVPSGPSSSGCTVRVPSAPRSVRVTGTSTSPDPSATRRQVASAATSSARAWSRRLSTSTAGTPARRHSASSAEVGAATPSAASAVPTTNSTASAARRPARTSPRKSGQPGVSIRLILTSRWTSEATAGDTDRCWRRASASWSVTVVPAVTDPARGIVPVAARSSSISVVLPAAIGPTTATERTADGSSGARASPRPLRALRAESPAVRPAMTTTSRASRP